LVQLDYTEQIFTNNPEQEIWNYIGDFESEHFCHEFIKKCIKIKDSWKRSNRILKSKKKSKKKLEVFNPIRVSDIKKNTPEIMNNTKQARDFYLSSKTLPLLSKPVVLHYTFEKLANILALITFREPSSLYAHGLTYWPPKPIRVAPNGLFQIFHDCYSEDISIYLEEREFKLENIVDAGQINYIHLYAKVGQHSLNINQIFDEKNKKEVALHELDREFIFIFALSTLARYRVNEWIEIISGKKSDLILKIRRYLQAVEILFPNLILNELYEKVLLFYEPARIGGPDDIHSLEGQ
jgi:hypothetical protein